MFIVVLRFGGCGRVWDASCERVGSMLDVGLRVMHLHPSYTYMHANRAVSHILLLKKIMPGRHNLSLFVEIYIYMHVPTELFGTLEFRLRFVEKHQHYHRWCHMHGYRQGPGVL